MTGQAREEEDLSGKFTVVVRKTTILHKLCCDGVGSHRTFPVCNVDLPVSLFGVCHALRLE